jgi:pimeloyl-ACP methyl ester carboxylesterase
MWWVAAALAGVVIVSIPGGQAFAADPPEQVWEGSLKVSPAVSLRLVFHVKERAGALSATMDSPDQGASDIAVDAVTRDKTKLTFEMKTLGAKFVGTLNAEETEAAGTFTQGGADFPLTLKKSNAPPTPAGAKPAANEQIWQGRLAVGAGLSLRVAIHIFTDKAGALTATFDSLDQGAKGLKVDTVSLDKKTLKLEMKQLASSYEGTLNAAGDEAVGTWTQAGTNLPLTFKKTDALEQVKRPQTPQPPYPYQSEQVSYPNKAAGITLAGTLTIPKGTGPFPAAILISGSGAQDRDETLFQHKPFAVIADAFTRRGIAVLRVDDRGVGGSSGNTASSTSEDFAGDVLTGVAFLKARRDIDPKSIGLIGHSEGGLIAPMAAAKSKDVAFIILMAGTGLPGEDILYLQGRLIAASMGAQGKTLDLQRDLQNRLFTIVKTEKDPAAVSKKLREAIKDAGNMLPEAQRKSAKNLEAVLEGQIKMVESPWFRYFLTYDPRPTLAKVPCPVLALVGEKDLQVPPKENLSEIQKALTDGGNRRVTVKELPGLNHLFQTCKTGSTAEYAQLEETIAPSALKLMGDWVLDHVQKH